MKNDDYIDFYRSLGNRTYSSSSYRGVPSAPPCEADGDVTTAKTLENILTLVPKSRLLTSRVLRATDALRRRNTAYWRRPPVSSSDVTTDLQSVKNMIHRKKINPIAFVGKTCQPPFTQEEATDYPIFKSIGVCGCITI